MCRFSLFYNVSIISVILTRQKYNLSHCESFTKSIIVFTNYTKSFRFYFKFIISLQSSSKKNVFISLLVVRKNVSLHSVFVRKNVTNYNGTTDIQ